MNRTFLERLHAAVPYINDTPDGAQRVRHIQDWDRESESKQGDRIAYEKLIEELLQQFLASLTEATATNQQFKPITLKCTLYDKNLCNHSRPEERRACFQDFVNFLQDRGYCIYKGVEL